MNTEKLPMPGETNTKPIERSFIGKPKPTPTETINPFPETTQADIDKQIATDKAISIELPMSIEKPLLETLPKNPSETPRGELVDRFEELALRCFNKENQLDMAKALIKNQEELISQFREANQSFARGEARYLAEIEALRIFTGKKD